MRDVLTSRCLFLAVYFKANHNDNEKTEGLMGYLKLGTNNCKTTQWNDHILRILENVMLRNIFRLKR